VSVIVARELSFALCLSDIERVGTAVGPPIVVNHISQVCGGIDFAAPRN
jgi:hypothetical protein